MRLTKFLEKNRVLFVYENGKIIINTFCIKHFEILERLVKIGNVNGNHIEYECNDKEQERKIIRELKRIIKMNKLLEKIEKEFYLDFKINRLKAYEKLYTFLKIAGVKYEYRNNNLFIYKENFKNEVSKYAIYGIELSNFIKYDLKATKETEIIEDIENLKEIDRKISWL